MNVSRRFFIGGAAAFGAFGGCKFLTAHDFRAGGKPNLKFGVVSDIHVRRIGGPEVRGSTATFRHTLEWFRDQGVDAVMIAGDMADFGMVDELEAVADAWYGVFPDGKALDGRRVEKVFVLGNHDHHGFLYGNGYAQRKYPDEAERWKHVLRADIKGHWQRIFHEDYSRFYRKDIKGYPFLGAHWDDGTGVETKHGHGYDAFGVGLKEFLDAKGGTLDPALPFFYVQHPHPKDTCYGSWAWGHDNGKVTATLSKFPNAVVFSGHSHYSLTDERSIWQGAFTSVGTSSLRYTGLEYDERPPSGYENSPSGGERNAWRNAWRFDAPKMMPRMGEECCQGMLWSVYDDCIVVKRREFLTDLDLGDDWVMPLPAAESKPFAFAEHARTVSAPTFPTGAKVTVETIKARNRGGKSSDGKETIAAVEKEAFKISVPPTAAGKTARLYALEFTAEAKDGTKKTKAVIANGFNQPLAHKDAQKGNHCVFAKDELPKGAVRFSVVPLNCFQRRGTALVSSWISVG